jgi:site-specific DNA-cytosine methylase
MNVLGLFSGVGGFELGLQNVGFYISALCEKLSKI